MEFKMKGRTHYCNCETSCINKGKLRKVKTWKEGKRTKGKAQVCLNNKPDCTCRYRTDSICNAFKY